MKKILLTLMALVAMLTAVEAKVIRIKLADGSQQVLPVANCRPLTSATTARSSSPPTTGSR
jgi:hypothetical protein